MLVAILLVALGTILAADIAYQSAMSARRSTATLSFDEALLVTEGAEALAAYGLKTVMQNSKPGASGGPDVYAAQPWAQPVGPLEVVPGVTLEANLEDMQGRFNLNWLVGYQGATAQKPDPSALAAFKKLLQLSDVDQKWADMVVDWIDRDTQPQTEGAEDSAYMSQNPPYLAANQYITSTTELLALPGFGRENYEKLAPYIAALPPATTLNICTAKGRVLDAFNPNSVEWEDETALQKNRASAPGCFPDLKDYGASFGADASKLGNSTTRFKTSSSYFRLSSLVTIGSAEFNLYSLLYLDGQGYFVHPIQRSFSPD
ncbi:MAG: type II secretion system minor pseudopilin GspK [Proteobacteria bacterium]|nr:type II secretion system minor pseudopilin GspK [Pseudomonadota bacterium]